WATVGALWGVVISAVYMLRAYRHLFLGPLPKKLAVPADLDWSMRVPLILLVATLLAVGFVPELLNQYIRPAINGILLVTPG
ncbi:MAG: NADH-quinone oxidoreductase subunit M, partial [Verrucomicrobiales bacterium]|nr:NADH-quinone oxidoreductase subunit M [Verrucomicrobiales bacterium]